jgi:hypothetical protein
VSNILPYHGLMHENTYKLLVEVDIPLHNVPVVGNCGMPLVLYLIQNLLSLILHLCSLLYLLSVRYTMVPDYTARYYTEVSLCCSVVARYYMVVVQWCMELRLYHVVVWLSQSSFMLSLCMHLMSSLLSDP